MTRALNNKPVVLKEGDVIKSLIFSNLNLTVINI